MLTLKSCEKVREPGFSRSECLELARLMDNHGIFNRISECDMCGHEQEVGGGMSASNMQRATIVAALREYACG